MRYLIPLLMLSGCATVRPTKFMQQSEIGLYVCADNEGDFTCVSYERFLEEVNKKNKKGSTEL